ncbi:MAG TPA: hypothetical protein VGY96_13885 [Streptosporangiaceae bacterium]|nr:hypothetical protein [Streptosporangiaceae bacterium]
MPDILPRRRVLLASAAALPALLGTAGCRSSDVFTGPDPLAGPPRLAPDVITLQAVIAAEHTMIQLYQAAIGGDRAAARTRGLEPLLAEHQQHLTRLRARLIVPAGASPSPGGSASPSPGAAGSVPRGVTIARLRAAERTSAADLVRRLGTVEPALAQLFASIAACDATHVAALGG